MQTFRSNLKAKPQKKQITVKKEHDYFVKQEADDGKMFISENIDVRVPEDAKRSNAKAKRKVKQTPTGRKLDNPVKQEPDYGQMFVNFRGPDEVSANQILQRKFEEMETEVERLKVQLESLEKKHQHERSELLNKNKTLSRENKSMAARIKQLRTGVDSVRRMNGNKHENDKVVLNDRNRDASSDASDEDVYEVDKIISHKTERGKDLFLIRWKDYGSSHNTWEQKENLNCSKKLQEYFSRI